MKRLLVISAPIFSAGIMKAEPGRGGYLGHRFMICAEGGYSPVLGNSFKGAFTHYDFRYGGNLGMIVGRRTQLNFSYERWSLGYMDRFSNLFSVNDRYNGNDFELSVRQFRKSRGSIAPIGKFYELGLS